MQDRTRTQGTRVLQEFLILVCHDKKLNCANIRYEVNLVLLRTYLELRFKIIIAALFAKIPQGSFKNLLRVLKKNFAFMKGSSNSISNKTGLFLFVNHYAEALFIKAKAFEMYYDHLLVQHFEDVMEFEGF